MDGYMWLCTISQDIVLLEYLMHYCVNYSLVGI